MSDSACCQITLVVALCYRTCASALIDVTVAFAGGWYWDGRSVGSWTKWRVTRAWSTGHERLLQQRAGNERNDTRRLAAHRSVGYIAPSSSVCLTSFFFICGFGGAFFLCITVLFTLFFLWLGSVMVTTLNLRSRGRGFDSRSGRYRVVTTWTDDCLPTGKPSRYITNHKGKLSLPSLRGR